MRGKREFIVIVTLISACGPDSSAAESDGSTTEVSTTSATGSTPTSTTTSTTGSSEGSSSTGDPTNASSETGPDSTSTTGGAFQCPVEIDANATVLGDSPLAAFDGAYAWFGICECAKLFEVVIAEDPADLADQLGRSDPAGSLDPGVRLAFMIYDGQTNTADGPHTPAVTHRDGGRTAETDGVLTITGGSLVPIDNQPAHLVGTLDVSGMGWNLQGSLDAIHCPELDNWFCPPC